MPSPPPQIPPSKPTNILFVCLGNICRSPMAEAVFLETIQDSSTSPSPIKFGKIDSCGTAAYHVGSRPDPRTTTTLKNHSITTYSHSARKLCEKDFTDFDWIFGMDGENVENILAVKTRLVNKSKREGKDGKGGREDGRQIEKKLARVEMWGGDEEVDDPYYGGDGGFEKAYGQMVRFGEGFLKRLLEEREGKKRSSADSTL